MGFFLYNNNDKYCPIIIKNYSPTISATKIRQRAVPDDKQSCSIQRLMSQKTKLNSTLQITMKYNWVPKILPAVLIKIPHGTITLLCYGGNEPDSPMWSDIQTGQTIKLTKQVTGNTWWYLIWSFQSCGKVYWKTTIYWPRTVQTGDLVLRVV